MQVRKHLDRCRVAQAGKMAFDEQNVVILDDRIVMVKRVLKLSALAYAGFGDLVNSRATDSAILASNMRNDWTRGFVHDPIGIIIKAILRPDQVISNHQSQINSIHPRKLKEQSKNHSTYLAGIYMVQCILLYPHPPTVWSAG